MQNHKIQQSNQEEKSQIKPKLKLDLDTRISEDMISLLPRSTMSSLIVGGPY
jgi:hypothetical protein